MAGSLQINPLTKSYDDLRRCKKRLVVYLKLMKGVIDDETYQEIKGIIDSLDDCMNIIPEELRKNSYQIRKEYNEIRDND